MDYAKMMAPFLRDGEEAKPFPDEDRYWVTSYGRVFSLMRAKTHGPQERRLAAQWYGHQCVMLGGKVKKNLPVHRVVALTFLPPPTPEQRLVLHNDGNALNNRVDNLRWGTSSEAQLDRYRHGTMHEGENSPLALLTEEQVVEMREGKARGETQVALGERFGVHAAHVFLVVTGKCWKHAGGPIHTPRASSAMSAEKVIAIREDYAAGATQVAVAEKHGTTRANVYAIVTGKSWPDAGGPITRRRKRRPPKNA